MGIRQVTGMQLHTFLKGGYMPLPRDKALMSFCLPQEGYSLWGSPVMRDFRRVHWGMLCG